ncbi:MAG: MBL fold metallo-hydrolase [Pirellulaceae bacterium]|nr:MBL fold metallo-hydrolase [Pirellulaceae bacterium]
MRKQPVTRDISGKMILLGTGTSVGVPALGCGCDVCQSDHPRNNRTRCATILGLPQGNLLIDTPPDLRHQLLREKIGILHAVAYTHEHADHVLGMDDLRLFQFYLGHPVPVFCEDSVEQHLRATFSYAFQEIEQTHRGAVPAIDFHTIEPGNELEILGAKVLPIRLEHGPRFEVLGFRIGKVAYCTDTNRIPEASLSLLEGLDVLILDALRPDPHPTHLCLSQAIQLAQDLKAKRTIFTHCSCKMDYEIINQLVPSGMEMGYDGLELTLT